MGTDLSSKIRKARENKGLTLEQLAKMVGSSKSYMWQLESDPKIKPSAQLVANIASALDVTVDFLMNPESDSMNEADEASVFFREFKSLNANTKQQIMVQVKALKELQEKKKLNE